MKIALALLLLCSAAFGKTIAHVVHQGETVESLAADYYGNRTLAFYILEMNGLQKGVALRPGQTVHVPTAYRYAVKKGDTLELIAQRQLADKKHAGYLATLNALKPTDLLRPGQELTMPFLLNHHATAPETLASVAQQYYGDASKSKLLADFNARTSPNLNKGDRIVIPIASVRIRSIRLQPVTVPKAKGVPDEALKALAGKDIERREAQLAERIAGQLQHIEEAYQRGEYQDVPGALDKLLLDEEPSEAQLAEVFRLKAFAYVALGLDEPAVDAFRQLLARRPDFTLDEATVSPKIRAALTLAKAPKAASVAR